MWIVIFTFHITCIVVVVVVKKYLHSPINAHDMMENEARELRGRQVTEGFEVQDKEFVMATGVPRESSQWKDAKRGR